MALFLALFAFLAAWVSFKISTVRAVIFSTNEAQMITYLMHSTIKWSLIGMLFWMVVPYGWVLVHILAMRFVFMSLVDWHLICDNYQQIKRVVG